jgi:hypothetical protein
LIAGTSDLPPATDLPPAGSMLTRGEGEGVKKKRRRRQG